jgi:hypothetical protein
MRGVLQLEQARAGCSAVAGNNCIGCDNVSDSLSPMIDWVENDVAPSRVIAAHYERQ